MQNGKTQNHQTKSRVLSHYDRDMATIRHQKFLNEYNEYLTFKNSNYIQQARRLEKKIIKKWGLHYPHLKILQNVMRTRPKVLYSGQAGVPTKFLKPYFDYLERLKKGYSEIMTVTIDGVKELPPLDFFRVIKSKDRTKSIQAGKYVLLIVPIAQTKKRLMKDFEQIIEDLKRTVPKDNTKNREYQYNPWIVYDLCTYYRHKNPLKLAQKLSGIYENPAYSDKPELRKTYERLQRAYKQARKMIEQVGKEAESKIS